VPFHKINGVYWRYAQFSTRITCFAALLCDATVCSCVPANTLRTDCLLSSSLLCCVLHKHSSAQSIVIQTLVQHSSYSACSLRAIYSASNSNFYVGKQHNEDVLKASDRNSGKAKSGTPHSHFGAHGMQLRVSINQGEHWQVCDSPQDSWTLHAAQLLLPLQ
jgi:hypothetical protein